MNDVQHDKLLELIDKLIAVHLEKAAAEIVGNFKQRNQKEGKICKLNSRLFRLLDSVRIDEE